MGQEEGTIPKISTLLKDHQEDLQSTMVKFEGKIVEKSISILINPGSTHSYHP